MQMYIQKQYKPNLFLLIFKIFSNLLKMSVKNPHQPLTKYISKFAINGISNLKHSARQTCSYTQPLAATLNDIL
jgi:hypothetical protein